jgi:hypothetical protein
MTAVVKGGAVMAAAEAIPRLSISCAGYEQICTQSNVKPVTVELMPAGAKDDGEHRSYCFVMLPPSPCVVSSIVIRNAGSAFISVHGATTEQAREYMERTDPVRRRAQAALIARAKANPKPEDRLVSHAQAASAPGPRDGKETAKEAVKQETANGRETAEAGEESMSFAASETLAPAAAAAGGPLASSTVGAMIDGWRTLVPSTQLLSQEQLVRKLPGKIDTVRTWRLSPVVINAQQTALLAVRCWPFYDRPRGLVGPVAVGLKWVAVYGRELGWGAA